MDSNARNGYRNLIRGEIYSLDNESIQSLNETTAQIQRERNIGPSLDEIKYLQDYIKLYEDVLNGNVTANGANFILKDLNFKYKNISESVRKDSIIIDINPDLDFWQNSGC